VAPKKKPSKASLRIGFRVVFISIRVRSGKRSSKLSRPTGDIGSGVMTASKVWIPKASVLPMSSRMRRFVGTSMRWNLRSARRRPRPSFSVPLFVWLFVNFEATAG